MYSRRVPFSPARLQILIEKLPADCTAALNGTQSAATADDAVARALASLVRSKGFLWLAASHDGAYYWSHAGSHFEAQLLGRWSTHTASTRVCALRVVFGRDVRVSDSDLVASF